ncbi:MAG: Gfo/Idh/MocA family oxidoreductase [Cyclobacteriaceae bacterium]|nr:Gfo/Idh/MocA family oxidoreductase [Cyclobacteriaceae bacterium]
MDSQIKTGIASYGMSGVVFHAPLLHVHSGFAIGKIVERSPKGSKERYPYVETCRSISEMLEDTSLELIVINTPDDTHYTYCKQALEAGKHVVVEKPFTIKVDDAIELKELAEKKGKVLSVFQNRRWDGDYLTVKKVIEEKMLGRLVSFESHFNRYRPQIPTGTWKEEALAGGEVLYNLGSHMIDQVYDLFGMPLGLRAYIGKQRDNSKIDDFYDVILYYDDLQVFTRASYLVREPGPRYMLNGTDGSFMKFGLDPQEDMLKAGNLPSGDQWGKEAPNTYGYIHSNLQGLPFKGTIETIPGNYGAYYDNIYEAIRHGKPLIVPPAQSIDLMRIIEAAMLSSAEKRDVSF